MCSKSLNPRFMKPLILKERSEFAQHSNFHNSAVTKFESNSTGVFFNGLFWTCEISPKKERVLLRNFRQLSNGCFSTNYGESLKKHISKLKCFPNSLDITQFGNTNYLRCVTNSELTNFWNFRCRKRSKTGSFATLIIESSRKQFF